MLLQRALDGDQDAWKQLYAENEEWMRMVLRNRIPPSLRRRMDPEDLMQSAFLVLSQRGSDLDIVDSRSFHAWLATVLLNKLRDRLRKMARASAAGAQEIRPDTETFKQYPDSAPSLEELAQKAELLARMYERILALPPDDRDIVLARYVDQLSWADIAKRSGLAPSTVTKRYNELLESIVRGFF